MTLILWAVLSASPLTPLQECGTIVYEKIGAMAYWRPQIWLTEQEENILNDLSIRKSRCIAKVYQNRSINHLTIIWKD